MSPSRADGKDGVLRDVESRASEVIMNFGLGSIWLSDGRGGDPDDECGEGLDVIEVRRADFAVGQRRLKVREVHGPSVANDPMVRPMGFW